MSKEKRKRQKKYIPGTQDVSHLEPRSWSSLWSKKKNRARDVYTSRAPSLPNPDHVGGGGGGHSR